MIHKFLELYKTETILLSSTKIFVFQPKISSPSSSQRRPKMGRNFHRLFKIMNFKNDRLRRRNFSSTMKNFVSFQGRCPTLIPSTVPFLTCRFTPHNTLYLDHRGAILEATRALKSVKSAIFTNLCVLQLKGGFVKQQCVTVVYLWQRHHRFQLCV